MAIERNNNRRHSDILSSTLRLQIVQVCECGRTNDEQRVRERQTKRHTHTHTMTSHTSHANTRILFLKTKKRHKKIQEGRTYRMDTDERTEREREKGI